TMMIGLVPGPLLAAALQASLREKGRRRALLNLGIAVATGCGLAAIWLASSWSTVLDYLTSAGYGSQAAQFGRSATIATIVIQQYLYLPLTILVAITLLAGVLSQL